MTNNAKTRRMIGGHAVVECLRNEGVRHVFNVPGESFAAVLDGLRDEKKIRIITNRQEGAACFMAEAYAKASRQVGVCMVTRGPGATNASIGILCAKYDSTPLVLLVGQVSRANRGREASQELDYGLVFGSMAKWVIEINDPRNIPVMLSRAFHIARSGRPGPVVVSLPRDMLDEAAEVTMVDPYPMVKPCPEPDLVREMVKRINAARYPVMMIGSGSQYSHAHEELVAFSEKFQIPAVTTFRRMDAFPNNHKHYLGNLSSSTNHAQDVLRESDLIVVVGSRMEQGSTANYTLPAPGQSFIQIYPDAGTIGQNQRPALSIVSDVKIALESARKLPAARSNAARKTWIGKYRAAQEKYATPPARPSSKVSMEKVMRDMKGFLPKDTIHTIDAGNFPLWVHRYIEFAHADSFFGPGVGSMGYGVPSGVGAKLAHPKRTVIAHCGDGGFLMTGQEMSTAVQFDVPIITIVYNNAAYATIRMNQEASFPGRPSGTSMVSPDFAGLGNAYGALGLKVTRDADFLPALKEAKKANRPALIEVMTDLEMLTPTATLSEVSKGKRPR